MVEETLQEAGYPDDICLQVSEMSLEAIHNALSNLTVNGGAQPIQAQGYTQPARTKEELLQAPAATDDKVSDWAPGQKLAENDPTKPLDTGDSGWIL